MAFECVVVTPEQQVLSESVQSAVLTAFDGELGILTNRAPLLVKLGVGPLRVTVARGQEPQVFLVDGGVAQMFDNRLTILTTNALPASAIDPAAAQEELNAATARTTTDAKSVAERQQAIRRAQAKLRIVGK